MPTPPPARRPHVFVYLVDALRADHLGCYGYSRPTSPNVDALAREATVFRAIAPSSWTKASVASLFTGRSPIRHRAQDRGDTLVPEAVTLSDRLSAAGYRTYALYANSWVGEPFGVDQGFGERLVLPARSDRLTRRLLARLARLAPEDRLFAYVHTIDPHAPYEPTPADRERFAPPGSAFGRVSAVWLEDTAARARRGEPLAPRLIEEVTALYDAEIAFNDRQFGRFLEELKRRGLYDDSLVVFTSDHGEELFDHGLLAHAHALHRELVQVPLVLAGPGLPQGKRVGTPLSNAALAPTLARLSGAELAGADPVLDLLAPPVTPVLFSTQQGFWNGTKQTPIFGLRSGFHVLHFAP
ncbi:MAG TPA: sulfatase, partial [Vicinamibacteria bacterium]|nr:sulfatase [Vicinamibacteria bacterium]